jgi:hypothetical protein
MKPGPTKPAINLRLPFRDTGGEKLLQYIWQLQYFNTSYLKTDRQETLQIIHPGMPNKDQGPDFLNAQIRVGSTILAGSVELHLKTSHWNAHGHQNDPNYKNVILHVVFEHDLSHFHLPVLELQSRVSNHLLERYATLMNSPSFIACAGSLEGVKEITWLSWKERLLAERLTRASEIVFRFQEQNHQHWEESFWWMLARAFGAKVNSDAFEEMARSVPVKMLARHKQSIHQLEALVFGQSGLLNGDFKEDYPGLLQREYVFLKKKYLLKPIHSPVYFLRMRPGNFPSIRLAQLAALIQNSIHLFSKILEMERLSDIKKLFDITANDYWHYHYKFDEQSPFKKKNIGSMMIDNLIINTVVPVLFAYGLHQKEEKYKTRAVSFLEKLAAEENATIRGFLKWKVTANNAFDSQALIELKTRYCDRKQCLKCAIGNAILKAI